MARAVWIGIGLAAIAALVFWVVTSEIRLHNVETLSELILQCSSCAEPGQSREHVHDCMAKWGYVFVAATDEREIVQPSELAGSSDARRYAFVIEYGADGRVKASYPTSNPRIPK